jgi:hypothetical protein
MTKITRKITAVVLIDHQVSSKFSMQAPHSLPSHLMAPTVTCCGLTSGNRAVLSPSARTGVSHLQTNHPTIPAIPMNTTSHSLPRQRTPGLAPGPCCDPQHTLCSSPSRKRRPPFALPAHALSVASPTLPTFHIKTPARNRNSRDFLTNVSLGQRLVINADLGQVDANRLPKTLDPCLFWFSTSGCYFSCIPAAMRSPRSLSTLRQ